MQGFEPRLILLAVCILLRGKSHGNVEDTASDQIEVFFILF
jgi:hypothetical protein